MGYMVTSPGPWTKVTVPCDNPCAVICDSSSNRSKEEGKDQESIQLSTTPDPGHQMGK